MNKINFKQKFKNAITPDRPVSVLQIILTVLFVSALMISNIISSRIFNFFGFAPLPQLLYFQLLIFFLICFQRYMDINGVD